MTAPFAVSEAALRTLDVALLLFFFLFFLAVIVWLTTRRRESFDRLSRLPLADDEDGGAGTDRVEGRTDER